MCTSFCNSAEDVDTIASACLDSAILEISNIVVGVSKTTAADAVPMQGLSLGRYALSAGVPMNNSLVMVYIILSK